MQLIPTKFSSFFIKLSSTSTKYSFPRNLQNQWIQSVCSTSGNLLSLFESSSESSSSFWSKSCSKSWSGSCSWFCSGSFSSSWLWSKSGIFSFFSSFILFSFSSSFSFSFSISFSKCRQPCRWFLCRRRKTAKRQGFCTHSWSPGRSSRWSFRAYSRTVRCWLSSLRPA